MFAIIKDNAFERFLPEGIAFKIGNTVYPQDWLNLSTPAEKAALGIVDVVYGERPDDKYYWVTELPPTYNAETKQVDVAYTSIAKDLAGCVKQAVDAINAQAYSILLPSDWMAVKAFETGSVVAEDWAAWRQEIRVQAAQAIAAIEACLDVEALAALPSVEWAHDPNWVEPAVEEEVK
jgi:hypothetical protein